MVILQDPELFIIFKDILLIKGDVGETAHVFYYQYFWTKKINTVYDRVYCVHVIIILFGY